MQMSPEVSVGKRSTVAQLGDPLSRGSASGEAFVSAPVKNSPPSVWARRERKKAAGDI